MKSRANPAITLLLLLASCGGDVPDSVGTAPSPRPSTSARLGIAAPETGTVVRGDRVKLVIELDGATLSEAASTDLRPDEGHLHVMLDGELVSMTSGLEQMLGDLRPGEHLLKVEFVANDHAPFDPRVLAAVSFTADP